jgi:hypothetical protein
VAKCTNLALDEKNVKPKAIKSCLDF